MIGRKDKPTIQKLWVNQVFDLSPTDEIRLIGIDRVFGNIQPHELFVLMTIVKSIKAENIFEFGTFDGRTTRCFALNIPQDGRVYKLVFSPIINWCAYFA